MAASLLYSEHAYGDAHELQKLAIWDFAPGAEGIDEGTPRYWLIYIHGGAWRDPREDLHGVEPTIDRLLSAGPEGAAAARARIAGFVSINYRLSPHPSFPQDAATTPASRLRDARHPDHVADVAAALSFLAGIRPGCLARYVLFGHSCGAFMAFQLLTSKTPPPSALARTVTWLGDNPAPAAVVGFEGIYDLRGLNDRKGGGYTELFAGPFGPDQAVWDEVSPARHMGGFAGAAAAQGDEGSGEQANGPTTKLLAVVAHSPEDELVDVAEQAAMERTLRDNGVQFLTFTDLRGKHQEVPADGTDMARVMAQTLATLDELETLSLLSA